MILIENKDYQSLENIYNDYCTKRFEDPNWLLNQSNKYLNAPNESSNKNENFYDSHSGNDNENEKDKMEKRIKIYDEACKLIPSTILIDRFTAANRLLSESYSARKEFASQLGLNYALQYLMSSSPFYPDQLEICLHSGNVVTSWLTPTYNPLTNTSTNTNTNTNIVISTIFSPSSDKLNNENSIRNQTEPMNIVTEEDYTNKKIDYKGDNVINKEQKKNQNENKNLNKKIKEKSFNRLYRNTDLPFRLTRNIIGSFSGHMVLGGITVSLGLVMDAFLNNKDTMECSLNILLYDDINARRRRECIVGRRKNEEDEILEQRRNENENDRVTETESKEVDDKEGSKDIDDEEEKENAELDCSAILNVIDIKVRSIILSYIPCSNFSNLFFYSFYV